MIHPERTVFVLAVTPLHTPLIACITELCKKTISSIEKGCPPVEKDNCSIYNYFNVLK